MVFIYLQDKRVELQSNFYTCYISIVITNITLKYYQSVFKKNETINSHFQNAAFNLITKSGKIHILD